MDTQTLDPTPRLPEEPPAADPKVNAQLIDDTDFIDPDDDEDCRAGLLEIDRPDDDDA